MRSDLLSTCGATLREFKQDGVNSERRYIIEKVFVETPVKTLYYGAGQKARIGIMYEHVPYMT